MNGYNVRNWNAFVTAWSALYNDTYFEVRVYRPSTGTTVTRKYRIVYPSIMGPGGG